MFEANPLLLPSYFKSKIFDEINKEETIKGESIDR